MEIQNMSEEDWEVLDYYCYAPEEEDDEYGEEAKQKWWKMGNWVKEAGKKLVMTGIVVSSAPVVLPPLLVVSALGLAMSFPFGFVFASYACTHKLMTKLLPPPNIIIPQQDEEEEDEMKKESEIRIELLEDEIDDEQVGEENVKARLEEEKEVQHAKLAPHHQESSTSSSTSSSQNENENGSINIDEEITKNEELDNEKIEQQTVLVNDAAAAAALDKPQNKKTTDQPPPQHKQVSVSEAKKTGEDSENRVVVNGDSDKESEAKTWEKINAIRVIVGFKAPRRSSYLEEIKALYLFTGIDPPSPSTTTSELDTNLSFLMSVIGLK